MLGAVARVSAFIASGTKTGVIVAATARRRERLHSPVIDGIVGAKVATSAMRRPASRAASSIASLGFSTGMRLAARALSIAAPNAEHV